MEPISEQEKNDFREFLSTIYGPQVNDWNINMKVLELFGKLLQSSESCSRYIDMVPRPFVVGNVIKWASRQARGTIIRHLKNGGKHYLICLRVVGMRMKSKFILASQGL